jgi:hypothetical protein
MRQPALPDEQDGELIAVDDAPTPLFVAEAMAFAAALLGAGLLFQAVLG